MVVIEMEHGGVIELELYPEAAPKTVANFLKLVGKSPFNADIRDYRNGVIDYLNSSYPYCFAISGEKPLNKPIISR